MNKIKRKWDLLSTEQRKKAINDIIYYFNNDREEDIGIISAEEILDFFLKELGANIYNKGIEDSKKTLNNSFQDMEINLDILRHTDN